MTPGGREGDGVAGRGPTWYLAFGSWLPPDECVAVVGAAEVAGNDDWVHHGRGVGEPPETVLATGPHPVQALVWDRGDQRHLLLWCETVDALRATRHLDRCVMAVREAEFAALVGPPTLPVDVARLMEAYGRQELAVGGVGFSLARLNHADALWRAPFVASPLVGAGAFVDALAAACAPVGHWAAYGAMRLVTCFLGDERTEQGWFDLLDAVMVFLRDSRVPWNALPVCVADWFEACGGRPEEWLPFRPPPEPSEVDITPLAEGEVRLLVEATTPQGPARVRVRVDGLDLVAEFDNGVTDPATGIVVWICQRTITAGTLHDLFIDVAWETARRRWVHEELRPFLPHPPQLI